jgi:raffinose/stachyose/melibiose transport system permease protein
MTYSSFKSNEELTRNIYAFPRALFDNRNDEYIVIKPDLNTIFPYDPDVDTRERLIIESTTIGYKRRLMLHFLLKEELPPEIARLEVGDTLTVSQLPRYMQREISWSTVSYNYRSAFVRGGLLMKFVNSTLYTTTSTSLIILLSMMISFALSKMRFKKLSILITGVIGLGYLISIQSLIIPLFLMLSSVGLTDTHPGIILVYTAFGMPLAVLLTTAFMLGLPDSLIESAYIDGATPLRTFTSIISPMCIPVIVTVSIISALGTWNEFLLVLILASSEATKSLPVGVFSFASLTSIERGWQMAALVIATAPAMIVYFIFNKRLTRGVVAGAIKG